MAEITECIECAVCGSVGRLISENTEVSGGTLTYICPRCQPSYDCEVRPNGLSPWEYEARCVADFLLDDMSDQLRTLEHKQKLLDATPGKNKAPTAWYREQLGRVARMQAEVLAAWATVLGIAAQGPDDRPHGDTDEAGDQKPADAGEPQKGISHRVVWVDANKAMPPQFDTVLLLVEDTEGRDYSTGYRRNGIWCAPAEFALKSRVLAWARLPNADECRY
jgi:hypothetical protein